MRFKEDGGNFGNEVIWMTELTTAAAIVAIVAAVKERVPEVTGLYTVLLAVVLGGLAGYLGLEGLTIQSGVIAGLTAIGGHHVLKR